MYNHYANNYVRHYPVPFSPVASISSTLPAGTPTKADLERYATSGFSPEVYSDPETEFIGVELKNPLGFDYLKSLICSQCIGAAYQFDRISLQSKPAADITHEKKMLTYHCQTYFNGLGYNLLFLWQDAIIIENETELIVACRGTVTAGDIWTDFQFKLEQIGTDPTHKAHSGFVATKKLFADTNFKNLNPQGEILTDYLAKRVNHHTPTAKNLIITGHSLGAGVATLLAYELVTNKLVDPTKMFCYLFGSPRVFNIKAQEAYDDQLLEQTFRIQRNGDWITKIPFRLLGLPNASLFQKATRFVKGIFFQEKTIDDYSHVGIELVLEGPKTKDEIGVTIDPESILRRSFNVITHPVEAVKKAYTDLWQAVTSPIATAMSAGTALSSGAQNTALHLHWMRGSYYIPLSSIINSYYTSWQSQICQKCPPFPCTEIGCYPPAACNCTCTETSCDCVSGKNTCLWSLLAAIPPSSQKKRAARTKKDLEKINTDLAKKGPSIFKQLQQNMNYAVQSSPVVIPAFANVQQVHDMQNTINKLLSNLETYYQTYAAALASGTPTLQLKQDFENLLLQGRNNILKKYNAAPSNIRKALTLAQLLPVNLSQPTAVDTNDLLTPYENLLTSLFNIHTLLYNEGTH
ncbi:MAG: hypothetical protein RLZ12_817 [Bacillota bacterium]|jgi:hypothetical protein